MICVILCEYALNFIAILLHLLSLCLDITLLLVGLQGSGLSMKPNFLISCFLFMMTNYIIEPSCAYYANALGSSNALSGLMIGLAPWFAIISAVSYSVWLDE